MVCEFFDFGSKLYCVEFWENILFYLLKLENDIIGLGCVICLIRYIVSYVFMIISK